MLVPKVIWSFLLTNFYFIVITVYPFHPLESVMSRTRLRRSKMGFCIRWPVLRSGTDRVTDYPYWWSLIILMDYKTGKVLMSRRINYNNLVLPRNYLFRDESNVYLSRLVFPNMVNPNPRFCKQGGSPFSRLMLFNRTLTGPTRDFGI